MIMVSNFWKIKCAANLDKYCQFTFICTMNISVFKLFLSIIFFQKPSVLLFSEKKFRNQLSSTWNSMTFNLLKMQAKFDWIIQSSQIFKPLWKTAFQKWTGITNSYFCNCLFLWVGSHELILRSSKRTTYRAHIYFSLSFVAGDLSGHLSLATNN